MELNFSLKMQRKWTTLIETSVVTIWLIVLFSASKTLCLVFSKPFPLSFFFSKLLGFFLHICKTNVSSRFLFWWWTNLASSLRKEASSGQTNKWRWPNTWGKWEVGPLTDKLQRISGPSGPQTTDKLNHIRAQRPLMGLWKNRWILLSKQREIIWL